MKAKEKKILPKANAKEKKPTSLMQKKTKTFPKPKQKKKQKRQKKKTCRRLM